MLATMNAPSPTRWYREPMVWMLIAIPGSAVVVGMIMLVVSIQGFDGMVIDDYYKRGMQINRVLDRDRAASAHGLHADLSLRPEGISLALQAEAGFAMPPSLSLGVYHATRGGMDRLLTLARGADGVYRASFEPLAPGAWDVQVEAGDWRLVGRFDASQRGDLQLTPALRPDAAS
jgi:hypothetical protein